MENTSYSLGPLWTAIRDEHRRVRAARAARRSLESELATYTSPGDLNDPERHRRTPLSPAAAAR